MKIRTGRATPASRGSRGRRGGQAGFTLIELMVVVVLIAILAVIATPAMRTARDDRQAFDYARQAQQLVHRARTLSSGTGGAHLIIAAPGAGRGHIYLFEALDSTPGATPPLTGPNPWSSCKLTNDAPPVAAWGLVSSFVPGNAATFQTNIVDGPDLDTLGVNVDANIKMHLFITLPTSPNVLSPTTVIAICVSGNGTTYAAEGPDVPTAIANMQGRPPFTGVAQLQITRNNAASAQVGLARNVMVAGSAAPRIFSQ